MNKLAPLAIALCTILAAACGDAPADATAEAPQSAPAISSVAPGMSAQDVAQALRGAAAPSEDSITRHDAGATAADGGAPVSAPLSRQGVFARRPLELPRAAPGAWADVYASKNPLGALTDAQKQSFADSGRAFLRRDFKDALERLYALLTEQPDYPPAQLMLGATYYKLRRYEDSIEAHERFLAHAPDQVGTTQALAHCYYGLGRYEQALAHYEAVVAANPSSPEALRGLALSKMRLGDLDGALEGLRRVLQLEPDHAEAQAFLAQVLYDQGESKAALEAAERARELAPGDPRPWYLISQCLHELGDDEAAELAQANWKEVARVAQDVRALEARVAYRPPDTHSLALRLVELHTKMRDLRGLSEALDIAAQSRPPGVAEVDIRILALDAFERTGSRAAAENAAQALEKLCAEDVAAWKRLEQWYQAVGDSTNQIRAGEMWRRLNSGEAR
ncbi:MAG: tetratricopeptide repeat protein [Planctomycetota bacterium]|nr:MAG: tetratricopeptide repeat protein [Planctomycetota bacterium]